MWYQRITEYTENDSPNPLDRTGSQKLHSSKPSFGQPPFRFVVFGPEEPKATSKKRKQEETEPEITQFKRVRLLSRKRKPVLTPFSRYAKSSNLFASKTETEPGSQKPIKHPHKVPTQSGMLSVLKDVKVKPDAKTASSDGDDYNVSGALLEPTAMIPVDPDLSSLNRMKMDLEMFSHYLRSDRERDNEEFNKWLENLQSKGHGKILKALANNERENNTSGHGLFILQARVDSHDTRSILWLDCDCCPEDSEFITGLEPPMETVEGEGSIDLLYFMDDGTGNDDWDYLGRSALRFETENEHWQVVDVLTDLRPRLSAIIPEAKKAGFLAAVSRHTSELQLILEHVPSHSS